MILQALTEYYQSLVQAEKIAAPGWKSSDISFVLCISDEGELEQVISIKNQVSQGKKTVLRPQSMILPVPADGRTSTAVRPNFLWDKSDYLLGISKGGTQRGIKYFNGAKEYHEAILSGVVSPAATALLAFFQQWNPEKAPEHPALQDAMEDILKGANMVFRYSGGYIHEDPEIRDAWQRHYADQSTGIEMTCLVTGKQAAVARIHPKIKGIINGEAMGNTLVGFNSPSVCSYGKEQSYNAPVSQQAAFAYTAALNYLLADREHVYRLGDATVVCWARGGGDAYQAFFGRALLGAPTPYSAADLRGMTAQLCQGIPVDFQEEKLDPNMDFYILGLSPNAARLSVRFFLHNTFQGFLEHIQSHYRRLEIIRPSYDKFAKTEPASSAASHIPMREKKRCVPTDSCPNGSQKPLEVPSSASRVCSAEMIGSSLEPVMRMSLIPRSAYSISCRIRLFSEPPCRMADNVASSRISVPIKPVSFSKNHRYAFSVWGQFHSFELDR